MRVGVSSLWPCAALVLCCCGVIIDTEEVRAPPLPGAGSIGVDDEDALTFDGQIGELLTSACAVCHDPTTALGGVDVTTVEAMVEGGSLVPGMPERSRILGSMLDGTMPPPGSPPVTDEQVDAIARWIAAGAP